MSDTPIPPDSVPGAGSVPGPDTAPTAGAYPASPYTVYGAAPSVAPASPTAAPPPTALGAAAAPTQPAVPGVVNAALRPLTRGPALATVGLTALVVLGTALVSAALLLAGLSMTGEEDLSVSASMLPVMMGFSLSGRLQMAAAAFGVSFAAGVTLLPLGTLVAVAVGVFILARRRTAVDLSAGPLGVVALRAGVESAAVAVVACLLTGLGSFRLGDVDGTTFKTSVGWILFTVWVIVFGALLLARAGSLLAARMPAGLRQVLRELGALVAIVGVGLGAISVVGCVLGALVNDAVALIPVIPVLAGNLIIYLLTLGTFGAITGSGSALGAEMGMDDIPELSGGVFAWTALGPWAVLLFIAMVLVTGAAAARIGVRRQRLAAADLGRAWQLPVVAFVLGLVVLHLLVPVRVSVAFLGPRASASAGPAWWSSLTLTVFVVAVSVLAEVLPAWMYANTGGLLRLCAGARPVDDWIAGRTQPAPPVATPSPLAATTTQPPAAASAPSASPAGYGVAAEPAATTAPGPAPTAGTTASAPLPPDSAGTSAPPAVAGTPAPAYAVSAESAAAPLSADTAAVAPPPPLPEPKPMTAAARRRMKLIAGVVLACVVVVGAGAIAVHVLNARRGPEGVVESYLGLIADGHAVEATAMVDPGVPNDQRLLLTDEVLGAATSRIEVVDVKAPADTDTSDGDSVTVTATLSLDGERFEVPITVRAGDKEYGLLNTWEVETSLIQPVTLYSSSLDAVTVGGTEIALEDSEYYAATTTQYVYYGVYGLGVGADVSDYLDPDTTSMAIKPVYASEVAVEGEATETLENLVLDAVNAKASDCVTPPGNMDEVCPYALQSTELDSLKVTAEATEVTVDGDSFKSGSITFTTRDNPTSWNKNPKDKDWNYTFSGTIEWPEDGDDEPTVTVTDSYVYYGY